MPVPFLFQGAHPRGEPSFGPFVWPRGRFFKGASPPLCVHPHPCGSCRWVSMAHALPPGSPRGLTCPLLIWDLHTNTRTSARLSHCPRPGTPLRSRGATADSQHCGVRPGRGSAGTGGCTLLLSAPPPRRARPAHMVVSADTLPPPPLQCLPRGSPPPQAPAGTLSPRSPRRPSLHSSRGK